MCDINELILNYINQVKKYRDQSSQYADTSKNYEFIILDLCEKVMELSNQMKAMRVILAESNHRDQRPGQPIDNDNQPP